MKQKSELEEASSIAAATIFILMAFMFVVAFVLFVNTIIIRGLYRVAKLREDDIDKQYTYVSIVYNMVLFYLLYRWIGFKTLGSIAVCLLFVFSGNNVVIGMRDKLKREQSHSPSSAVMVRIRV